MRKFVPFVCVFALVGAAPAVASTRHVSHPVFKLVVKRGSKLAHLAKLHDSGTPSIGSSSTTGTSTLQATVSAVSAGSLTLTIGAQQVTIALPAGLTLPSSIVGTEVTLDLSVAGGSRFGTGRSGFGGDDGSDDQGDDDGGTGSVGQAPSPGSVSIGITGLTRR